jgi:tripartite-type tricarboxylate transporter receptor subunit TctC
MHSPARRRALALLLAAPLLAPVAAQAQAYPNKPVRLVVGFAPGGGADVVARLLAQRLGENMKAQFVVENKSGAGGVIAGELVAKAPPDGYTLMLAPSSHVVNPAVFTKLPYDTEKGVRADLAGGVCHGAACCQQQGAGEGPEKLHRSRQGR